MPASQGVAVMNSAVPRSNSQPESTPLVLGVNEPSLPPTEAPAAASHTEVAPVLTPALLKLRAAAQRKVLGGALIEDDLGNPIEPEIDSASHSDRPIAPAPNGNALGRFVPVENESALAPFHERLEQLASGRDSDGKVRILAYGASHTQGDYYTGYLRYYLQSRFGNGGPGFVQLVELNPYYKPLDIHVESSGFRVRHAQRKDAPLHDGRYGLLGAAGVAHSKTAFARISPRRPNDSASTASRYELLYEGQPGGGELQLLVDQRPPITLPTAQTPARGLYYTFSEPDGWHQIEIRPSGNGSVRLYGLVVERDEPGIVIDTLGINGTRAANMLRWDARLWSEHVARRKPDLILLAYGTNEAVDTGQPIAQYRADLKRVIELLRANAPEAACLLVGPGDFPKEVNGNWIERPRLLELIDVQRELAPEMGCGFWDGYEAMGGSGSMHRWVVARPRMGSPDHIHLTARGYVKMGLGLGDALMRAYDAARVVSGELEARLR